MVVAALARLFNITELGYTARLSGVIDYLRDKRLLLIFDNCEHLGPACYRIVMSILDNCPNIRIICTGREPANIPGELVLPLEGLSTPSGSDLPIARSAAATLLVARASKQYSPALPIGRDDLRAINAICCRLEGIPLALELAAGWSRIFSWEEVTKELDTLLTRALARGRSPERHTTLTACLDWSAKLLSPDEQTVFMMSSIFSDGMTMDSAIGVLSCSTVNRAAIIQSIGRLVQHHLLYVEDNGIGTRFRMRRPVRDFAFARLCNDPALYSIVAQRHLQWHVGLAESTERDVHGQGAKAALGLLDQELNNIRDAIEYGRQHHLYDVLSRFTSMYWYWFLRGLWAEATDVVEEIRTNSADVNPNNMARVHLALGTMQWASGHLSQAMEALRAAESMFRHGGLAFGVGQAMHIRGHVLHQQGDLEAALHAFEQATVLWRNQREMYWLALLLVDVGVIAAERGELDKAKDALEEAATIARSTDDKHGLGNALMNLGVIALRSRDFALAAVHLEGACRELGELGYLRGVASTLKVQADLEIAVGRYRKAAALLTRALQIQMRIRHTVGMARSIEALAHSCCMQGLTECAARCIGFAERLRDESQSILVGVSLKERDRTVEICMRKLGKESYTIAREAGRGTERKEMVATVEAYLRLSSRGARRDWLHWP
jgi:predicted ATPase/Tfp pilus assembly protein PilF